MRIAGVGCELQDRLIISLSDRLLAVAQCHVQDVRPKLAYDPLVFAPPGRRLTLRRWHAPACLCFELNCRLMPENYLRVCKTHGLLRQGEKSKPHSSIALAQGTCLKASITFIYNWSEASSYPNAGVKSMKLWIFFQIFEHGSAGAGRGKMRYTDRLI